MNPEFKNKYLKYKIKYLTLKEKNILKGGMEVNLYDEEEEENKQASPDRVEFSPDYVEGSPDWIDVSPNSDKTEWLKVDEIPPHISLPDPELKSIQEKINEKAPPYMIRYFQSGVPLEAKERIEKEIKLTKVYNNMLKFIGNVKYPLDEKSGIFRHPKENSEDENNLDKIEKELNTMIENTELPLDKNFYIQLCIFIYMDKELVDYIDKKINPPKDEGWRLFT